MSLRFHEISEANHHIQNPLSAEKLRLIGTICEVSERTEILDLACGKGELLCQWAADHGATGTGVDISDVFIEQAIDRATEYDVSSHLTFERGDAVDYPVEDHDVDISSCIGASWIGDGLLGTLELLNRARRDETSLLLVGEPFWNTPPPAGAVDAVANGEEGMFETLPGLLDTVEEAGYDLVEMVLSNHDDWDRYVASQWKTVDEWVRDHPDDSDAEAIDEWISDSRQAYLQFGREYLGWGVFVFRHPSTPRAK